SCVAARNSGHDGSSAPQSDGAAVTVTTTVTDGTAPAGALPYYVDALVNEYDYQWGSNTPGTAATVTYSFLASVPGYYASNATERSNSQPMNATQQAAVREILQMYSSAANINFVEVSGVGSITFGTANLGSGIAGWAYYPYPGYSGSSDNSLFGD